MNKSQTVIIIASVFLAFTYVSFAADKPHIILEPHPNTAVKSYMNSQKVNMTNTIVEYIKAVKQLPESCHARQFLEKANQIDKIPGNNQDIALVLIQSLSLDIDQLIDSLGPNDPNPVLKMKGIMLAATAYDNLLEGLKAREKILDKFSGF
ncbi:MAG: hypothetical protein K2Y18_02415 [Alphaproteobacteria bacterium]|jgi:hypothetical protein|nr:hypothetical protein [Alphaproteobacteria bacterium]